MFKDGNLHHLPLCFCSSGHEVCVICLTKRLRVRKLFQVSRCFCMSTTKKCDNGCKIILFEPLLCHYCQFPQKLSCHCKWKYQSLQWGHSNKSLIEFYLKRPLHCRTRRRASGWISRCSCPLILTSLPYTALR